MSFKDKLFSQGAAAINALGIEGDFCACPICLRLFNRDAIKLSELTAEHVPQRSLGGRKVLLTCSECNSTAGHTYESDLAKKTEFERKINMFLSGGNGSMGHVDVEFSGKIVRLDWSKEEGTHVSKVLTKHSNPQSAEAFTYYLKNLRQGDEFRVNISARYKESKVKLAYLKSAYLIMVAKFGFCYATEQNIQDLRNAVRFGKEDFPYADTINSEIPSLHTFIDSSYRFGIVRIGSKGILVPLPFITQEDFKNLCEVGPPSQARGKIFKNPCSFIAEVDLSGRINREIVEQA